MNFWRDKRVLLTGHTGFKGSWLQFWLEEQGAEVHGLSLPASTSPSLHHLLFPSEDPRSLLDIRDRTAVQRRVLEVKPEIVFHLAAQPLVRAGYRDPVETFETNVQGTVNLLDALRIVPDLKSIVVVTTDKVYENPETALPFSESDSLGGHDPYSASKAAADIVTASYRRSFFAARQIGLATARAGNVIGGGDWAEDRLIPDAVRAHIAGAVLDVRRPAAIRPWQHVLEPLHGYMLLAEALCRDSSLAGAYNFGPDPASAATVRTLMELSQGFIGSGDIRFGDGSTGPHEAGFLMLDSRKAENILGYRPRFSLEDTISRTWNWYKGYYGGRQTSALCLEDLRAFGAGGMLRGKGSVLERTV